MNAVTGQQETTNNNNNNIEAFVSAFKILNALTARS